jgi:hypothetical protein
MVEISDSLVEAVAIQFFISRNREMDSSSPTYHTTNNTIDRNWRDEVVKWKALNEDERKVLLDASRKYLVDWCTRYNVHAQYLIDNWQEIAF